VNCYGCNQEGRERSAVGICKHCGAGLCPEHLSLAQSFTVGGTTAYACPHQGGGQIARARETTPALAIETRREHLVA